MKSTIQKEQESIANAILGRFPLPIEFKSQLDGSFAGLVGNTQMWLCGCMRATLSSCSLYLVHNFNSEMHVATIKQDSNYTIATNNQGTVELRHSNSAANVYAFAIRLF